MDKIAIVTDTNSGMTEEEAEDLGVHLLPMPFIINGTTYFENLDLTQEEFYKYLEEGADLSTSQPAPGDLLALWNKLLKSYDYILHIPMSSTLSSSTASACMFAQEFNGKVLVADNKRISVSLQQAVRDAVTWKKEGLSASEIRDRLEQTSNDANIYLSVDTLKYLKKGGRITPAVAAIGSLFHMKPVLTFKNGDLGVFKKTRGRKSSWKNMLQAVKNDSQTEYKGREVLYAAAYSGEPELGKAWEAYIREEFPEAQVSMTRLPLSISTHLGPGVCGIACMAKH